MTVTRTFLTGIADSVVVERHEETSTIEYPRRETISFIVPTIGRASLTATLASIELYPGDEILVARAFNPVAHEFGARERNTAIGLARGSWLAFLDDDDQYVIGHRAIMSRIIRELPYPAPIIFRMQYPNGRVLWRDNHFNPHRPNQPIFQCGNVGTPMFVVPNNPALLGQFSPDQQGDFQFLNGSKWPRRKFVFRPEIIAAIGHN